RVGAKSGALRRALPSSLSSSWTAREALLGFSSPSGMRCRGTWACPASVYIGLRSSVSSAEDTCECRAMRRLLWSALRDRRVLCHELALRTVGCEAHDDDPAGLDSGHDALAERGVHDVVAHAVVGGRRLRARGGP